MGVNREFSPAGTREQAVENTTDREYQNLIPFTNYSVHDNLCDKIVLTAFTGKCFFSFGSCKAVFFVKDAYSRCGARPVDLYLDATHDHTRC